MTGEPPGISHPMLKVRTRSAQKHDSRRAVVNRRTWLELARDTLIDEGIESVKIDRLASRLKISRSSFYWQFKNRAELLDALLQYWRDTSDRVFRQVVADPVPSTPAVESVARHRLEQLATLFIHEQDFFAKFDLAVRDWSRKEAKVAALVSHTDSERIALFQRIFLDIGESETDSLVRARILYFHQLGYYLVGFQESAEKRKRIAPRYLEILSGLTFPSSGD